MKTYLRTILFLGLAVALAACGTSAAAPTQVPTVNVEPTLNAARTEAAATVSAAIAKRPTATQPAPTSTTAATATAIPTATPVAPAATATTAPQPVNTATTAPTAKPTTSGVVFTLAPVEFGCKITASTTTGDAKKAGGSDFDARWTVKNTGTSAWEKSTIDYKYNSGTKMYKSGDVYDLKTAVAVNDSIDIVVDMKAPTTPGNYQSNWAVVRGGTVLCTLPVLITVK
jgi:hypothetical protein